ncbi:MAG: ATP-binding cassette domain-containing protein [Methanobacteriaceae archaeon]|nr:ATP-binding cassette domain-containing protein [Candidatus Methanorudis spinitermitis]
MSNSVKVKNLVKSYGNTEAVNGISFYVEKGKLFAFLGPNGAGKSTTIDILCTLLEPDSGNVLIDGYSLGEEDDNIRSEIGVVFQDSLLDPLLTVEENLKIRGSFYNLSKKELEKSIQKAITVTGCESFSNRRYGNLSGGQKRRADIARALINKPNILFLDEPTTGLDPQTRENIWKTIKKLQKENDMTVFLTTHYMEEASGADYVIIIDNGKIIAKGTPDDLRSEYSSNKLKIKTKNIDNLLKIAIENSFEYYIKNDIVNIKLENNLDAINIVNKIKDDMINFEVINGTMDDAFIEIIGKGLP